MQYGQLITRSLSIVWRRRYLWLLAILGGADVGGGFGGGFPSFNASSGTTSRSTTSGAGTPGGTPFPTTPAGPPAQQVSQFFNDNLGLIVPIVVIVVLLALAWFLLSCITTGALVRASAEHDAERPFGFGPAWRAGLGTFWSILGLRLLGLVVALVAFAVIAFLVLLGFLAHASGQPALLAAVVAFGVLVVLALIPAAIVVGIVFILATRSVVLDQLGAVAALGRALRLMGARLGRALLVWLIQVGLSIGAGVAILIVLLIPFVILGGLVLGIGVAAGPVAAIAVGIPAGLLLLAGLILLGGITGSYFSTYWTLAFRRMELDAPQPASPGPPPGYPPQPAG